jgi:TRAP-type C4-dicarboxylate transport system permease small subunit
VKRLWKKIIHIDDFIGMVMMAFIIILACMNVFMRYILGKPWGWAEEVTVFTFVWLTMFGACSVIKVEGHCSIDVLARKLSLRNRRILDLIVDIFVITALILLMVYGTILTLKAWTKTTPMLGIPYSFVDAAIPIAAFIMLFYYGRRFWKNVTGKKYYDDVERED